MFSIVFISPKNQVILISIDEIPLISVAIFLNFTSKSETGVSSKLSSVPLRNLNVDLKVFPVHKAQF